MKRTLFLYLTLSAGSWLFSQDLANDPVLRAYRKGLERIDTLMQKGILIEEVSGLKYFTGYAYKTLYDWDLYFEAILQIYMGWPADYIKNGVIIFLQNQQENGFIPRSVPSNEWHDAEHVKPFLSQIALLVYRAFGEVDWITGDGYSINSRNTSITGSTTWMRTRTA